MQRDEVAVLTLLLAAAVIGIGFLLPATYFPQNSPGLVCISGPPMSVEINVNGTNTASTCSGNLPHYESISYQFLGAGGFWVSGTYWIKYSPGTGNWFQV